MKDSGAARYGVVPGALSSAMSRGPTVHCNENSSLHLSKPTRGLRQWKSLSRVLPSLRPSILRATTEIYLAVRQERQCKSNPPPINYLFHSPFSSFSLHLPPPVPHPRPTAVPLFLYVTFPHLIPVRHHSTFSFPLQYKLACQRGSCDVENLPL